MTGAGMMDCKKALTESGGDFDAAVDFLRKKGQKVSAKRSDREAKEGVIVTAVSEDGGHGVIVEVNCETDFVARNEEFQAFAADIASIVLAPASGRCRRAPSNRDTGRHYSRRRSRGDDRQNR